MKQGTINFNQMVQYFTKLIFIVFTSVNPTVN